ncbi:MAG: hypothetical protein GY950_06725, partial [bacterium]|nr:hypothetical protein [bacterium]
LIFIFAVQAVNAGANRLKLVKTIGDDTDDFTIFGLADAVLSENNDIYILSAKANFVARYSWDGTFKGRLGNRGQGPSDFYFPSSLFYKNKRLYILDRGNKRIAEMDTVSGKLQYYKVGGANNFDRKIFALSENTFLGSFSSLAGDRGLIGIVDGDWNIKRSFFNQLPVPRNRMKLGFDKFSKEDRVKIENVLIAAYAKLAMDIDPVNNELLVAFLFPDNPVKFFVFNMEGKPLKEFSYEVEEKKYKFFYWSGHPKKKAGSKAANAFKIRLDSVFIHKDRYLVFLNLEDRNGPREVFKRRT